MPMNSKSIREHYQKFGMAYTILGIRYHDDELICISVSDSTCCNIMLVKA